MSNTAVFGISVKDYAAQRGKTVQAVYQQMKRKENAAQLEGHVQTQRVGNKNVKYLDDEAIAILDKSSHAAPLVVVEEGLRSELEEAKAQIEALKFALAKEQGKYEAILQQLDKKEAQLEEKDEQLRLLAAPEAQIRDLSAERDELGQKAAQAEKTSQELSDELTAIKRTLWYKLFGKKK